MKYTMYSHGGSANHGCEAIVRATASMLGGDGLLVSCNVFDDKKYGLGKTVRLAEEVNAIKKRSFGFLRAYTALKLKKDPLPMERLTHIDAVDLTSPGDIALSIGGDNYCYVNFGHYILLHGMYKKRGAKTVLWGCSVEPDMLKNSEVAADIASYDLITAREAYSYAALKEVNPNTVHVADPAFILKAASVTLPKQFIKGNTVGVNISPMVITREKNEGMTIENYLRLCRYILGNTDMNIALIPHVVWADGDDRVPLKALYDALDCPDRVCLIEDCGCETLKGYISNCRFFVAARTHASIAAYSSCIPTLVVGYSVKARGIARDIFGSEDGYVLPIQDISEKDVLTKAFTKIADNEANIKASLTERLPAYKEAALDGARAISELEKR